MLGLNTILLHAEHSFSPSRSLCKIKKKKEEEKITSNYHPKTLDMLLVTFFFYGHLSSHRVPDHVTSRMSLWLHKHSEATQRSTIYIFWRCFLLMNLVILSSVYIPHSRNILERSIATLTLSAWPALGFDGASFQINRWKSRSNSHRSLVWAAMSQDPDSRYSWLLTCFQWVSIPVCVCVCVVWLCWIF